MGLDYLSFTKTYTPTYTQVRAYTDVCLLFNINFSNLLFKSSFTESPGNGSLDRILDPYKDSSKETNTI